MLLVKTDKVFLSDILMMRKHQVKLKQTWIAKIEFNVLYHSIYKDSNKDT